MGSHLDTTGLEGVHYLIVGDSVSVDAASSLRVDYGADTAPRSVAVTVTAKLPQLSGDLKAVLVRTGLRSDGTTPVCDRRPIPIKAETVVATDASIVPVPVAVAMATGDPSPAKRRRKVKKASELLAWQTQFSVTVNPADYNASDRAIITRANGDVTALYHTGFRVEIFFVASVRGKEYRMSLNVYVRAPLSMPFSPVACPARARDAIRKFVGLPRLAGRDAETTLCTVPLSLLRNMRQSGDAVHAGVAQAIFARAMFGYVTGETSVLLVAMRPEIFRLPGIKAISVAEAFIALSLLSQLPLGFRVHGGGRGALELNAPHWTQIYSTGEQKLHTAGPPAFCLGPRLELRPNFDAAVDPRTTRRYWCSSRCAERLPMLRKNLASFSRAVQLDWCPVH